MTKEQYERMKEFVRMARSCDGAVAYLVIMMKAIMGLKVCADSKPGEPNWSVAKYGSEMVLGPKGDGELL